MSEERLNELKQIAEHPKSEEELRGVFTEICERLNNDELTDVEICEIFKDMHFPDELSDELKEFLQNDEETTLKK